MPFSRNLKSQSDDEKASGIDRMTSVMPSLVGSTATSVPTYLKPAASLGEVFDLYSEFSDESAISPPLLTTHDGHSGAVAAQQMPAAESQASSELTAAVKYLCEKREFEESVGNKLQRSKEVEVLLSLVTNAKMRDTRKITRLFTISFLEALEQFEENDKNAGSLQGCMQVLHLRLVSTQHLQGGGLLDLVRRISSSVRFGHLRLLFLSLIYNSISEEHGNLRLYVLVHTVHLATMAGLTELLLPGILPRVEEFVRMWDLSKVERRKLYRVVAVALKKNGDDEGCHMWNMKYLQTFDGEEENSLEGEEVREITRKAVIDGIRLKTMFRFDALMDMDAIKALKDDEDCAALYALSQVFVNGSVYDYMKWYEGVVEENSGKNVGDIEGLGGIEHDMCLEKMRLLTFSSMGIEAQEMSYEEVAKGLAVDKLDVEDWVVKAISAGLVDAKMDQLEEKVRVYRSTRRTFTRAEWAPLSDRINVWKANVADLLEALKATRQASKIVAEAGNAGLGL